MRVPILAIFLLIKIVYCNDPRSESDDLLQPYSHKENYDAINIAPEGIIKKKNQIDDLLKSYSYEVFLGMRKDAMEKVTEERQVIKQGQFTIIHDRGTNPFTTSVTTPSRYLRQFPQVCWYYGNCCMWYGPCCMWYRCCMNYGNCMLPQEEMIRTLYEIRFIFIRIIDKIKSLLIYLRLIWIFEDALHYCNKIPTTTTSTPTTTTEPITTTYPPYTTRPTRTTTTTPASRPTFPTRPRTRPLTRPPG